MKKELQTCNGLVKMFELECQQLRKEVAKLEAYKNKEENQVKYVLEIEVFTLEDVALIPFSLDMADFLEK